MEARGAKVMEVDIVWGPGGWADAGCATEDAEDLAGDLAREATDSVSGAVVDAWHWSAGTRPQIAPRDSRSAEST